MHERKQDKSQLGVMLIAELMHFLKRAAHRVPGVPFIVVFEGGIIVSDIGESELHESEVEQIQEVAVTEQEELRAMELEFAVVRLIVLVKWFDVVQTDDIDDGLRSVRVLKKLGKHGLDSDKVDTGFCQICDCEFAGIALFVAEIFMGRSKDLALWDSEA